MPPVDPASALDAGSVHSELGIRVYLTAAVILGRARTHFHEFSRAGGPGRQMKSQFHS